MIVDRAFFIACRKAPGLLQPVDHPLHPCAGAVDSPVQGAFLTLRVLPRKSHAPAMLPGLVPNPPPAVPLVAHATPGAALGPAAPRPLPRPRLHQGGKDRGVMPVARGQDERPELPATGRPPVDCGTEASWAPAKRFRVRRPVFAPAAC